MSLEHLASAEDVFAAVRADGIPGGGSAFGRATAFALRHIALDQRYTTREALFAELHRMAEALRAEMPTMAPIHNARALIVDPVEAGTCELEAARAEVVRRADLYTRLSSEAVEALGRIGANLVQDGQAIMMHSYSQSVMTVLLTARRLGKAFRVICTESRPGTEALGALAELTEAGIPVTYGVDAAMNGLIREADWCLTGADSLTVDGAAANKVGSSLLALVARHYHVPFYVAAETLKTRLSTGQGVPVDLPLRPGEEVLAPAALRHPERVTVFNPMFDLIDPAYIRAVITERGLYPPALISQAWQDTAALFEPV